MSSLNFWMPSPSLLLSIYYSSNLLHPSLFTDVCVMDDLGIMTLSTFSVVPASFWCSCIYLYVQWQFSGVDASKVSKILFCLQYTVYCTVYTTYYLFLTDKVNLHLVEVENRFPTLLTSDGNKSLFHTILFLPHLFTWSFSLLECFCNSVQLWAHRSPGDVWDFLKPAI